MKRSPSLFSVFLIALLVLFTAGQGLASSFVLCIAENGNTSIEQASFGQCEPVESSACAPEEFADHDDCGPCEDVFTSLDFAHGPYQSDHDPCPKALIERFVSIAPFTLLQDLPPNLFGQPPPRPNHALTALRTIVLLI